MGFAGFAVGRAVLVPSGTNPTPAQVGILKDWNWEASGEVKELYGEGLYAEESLVAKRKVSGKLKFARFGSGTLAALLGSTASTGYKIGVIDETATIPGTPYQVTVANGATFYEDLGVIDTSVTPNLVMTRVASAPATGQYSVVEGTGVYTFAAADTTHTLLITYSYTSGSTGKTIALTQALAGTTPYFKLEFFNTVKENHGFRFPRVIIPKLSFAMKQDDFAEMDFDFTATKDPTTNRIAEIFLKD